MDRTNVPALETRQVEYDRSHNVTNEPPAWKYATAEGLGGESMLGVLNFAREHAPSVRYDGVLGDVSVKIASLAETTPPGRPFRIVDIVKTEHDKMVAVLEWDQVGDYPFDDTTEDARIVHLESRGALELSHDMAMAIAEQINDAVFDMLQGSLSAKHGFSVPELVSRKGLDDASIAESREDCLRLHGLDPASVAARRVELLSSKDTFAGVSGGEELSPTDRLQAGKGWSIQQARLESGGRER